MAILSLHYRMPEDGTFDFDYYTSEHLRLVQRIWGPLLTQVQVLKGVAAPGSQANPDFALITLLHFASDADLTSALAHPEAGSLQQDIANFSPVLPAMQFNSELAG
ncbi:EthD family reductase [Sphingomonas sp.]|uniref:EthD family reductase n=1 Tax=Sphingomonas sp. TaxID=28214 RepID=UPI001EBB4A44|nr:EthD family reductase [Sphingomonas sp.]MBX3593414.1 EthD family reductase [Sphingomonas sp.]